MKPCTFLCALKKTEAGIINCVRNLLDFQEVHYWIGTEADIGFTNFKDF